jgi:hypothetical protein
MAFILLLRTGIYVGDEKNLKQTVSKTARILVTLLISVKQIIQQRREFPKSDTPGEAGGLMSGVASKAITQVI